MAPADDSGIDRSEIVKAAEDAVGNLIYTAIFDTCNEFISSGADQDAALRCANKVVASYMQGGIKVRKKPTPKAKTTKVDNAKDALSAASRKLNNLASNAVWIIHPQSSEYSYTTSLKLGKGFPVRNNATGKVVMIISENSTDPLTTNDAKVGYSMGLDIDFSSVQS